ncbi:PHP domain-like protein [Punctularia strigosozonata HHB-11173 SS5]|uniref:PHP domain-like protein n=1 Tax=Punctularia strigosozonata (strain HHB-11173) TaxID=741275 RepID=UPI00044164D5|nr:PHP domain-like protein [Punctularia strigosozonata HHB-11173 SS5]EIN05447.1 PHP domain-like protein [Punctularia strigosozonata HHB-11173 SS5]
MYFDFNVPIRPPPSTGQAQQSKKAKGKQSQQASTSQQAPNVVFPPGQLASIEKRIDLLVHMGYTVLALTQTLYKKLDQKSHVNILDPLLAQMQKRKGIVFLKRLTIVLDEDSEKGFGLTNANIPLLSSYDILALTPTTSTTLSLACLTHSQPSNLTTHIISLPLTLPRLPYHLKHTLVRTALRNGAVFEICYAGALGESMDLDGSGAAGGSDGGAGVKRNWWAGAREVARVTKGKGFIVSSGAYSEASMRAPRDVGNLIALLGLAQDAAHDASTKTCKSLVLRAQTRKTYRAILSEPKLVIPSQTTVPSSKPAQAPLSTVQGNTAPDTAEPEDVSLSSTDVDAPPASRKRSRNGDVPPHAIEPVQVPVTAGLDTSTVTNAQAAEDNVPGGADEEGRNKKKRKQK